MAASDKNWAHDYVINPLIAPEPSEQTGPGTHFRSTFDPAPSPQTSTKDSLLEGQVPAHRVHAIHNDQYYDPKMEPVNHKSGASPMTSGGRVRGSSLSEKVPKEKIPKEKAQRSPSSAKKETRSSHKTHKKRVSDVDVIDTLDVVPGGRYHHEGPYDATLLARNLVPEASPVAAVADSNMEALKATPKENISDSLNFHRPLDGTARVPPGQTDEYGRVYDYQETNVNAEERDDLDRNNKQKKKERYEIRNGISEAKGDASGIELEDQIQKKHVQVKADEVDAQEGSSKRHSLSGLKKRLSIRKKKD